MKHTTKIKVKFTKTTTINLPIRRKGRKKGSGRTKGSYSFVRVNWSQLREYVGQSSHVLVSRKWAENVGLFFAASAPANVLAKSRLTR